MDSGVVADHAQVGLSLSGHEEIGKAVGATGNVVSGAACGFVLGGPPGAAIGAAVGGGVWYAGEYLGKLFFKQSS